LSRRAHYSVDTSRACRNEAEEQDQQMGKVFSKMQHWSVDRSRIKAMGEVLAVVNTSQVSKA
jgi:hypothetical protein